MQLSKKRSNIINKLMTVAENSSITHKHAAVVVSGGKTLAWGFNSIKGGKTIHAEHAALQSFMNHYRVTLRRRKERYILPGISWTNFNSN